MIFIWLSIVLCENFFCVWRCVVVFNCVVNVGLLVRCSKLLCNVVEFCGGMIRVDMLFLIVLVIVFIGVVMMGR